MVEGGATDGNGSMDDGEANPFIRSDPLLHVGGIRVRMGYRKPHGYRRRSLSHYSIV